MMENRDAPGLAAIGPWFCESKTLFNTSDQVFDCNASPLGEAPFSNYDRAGGSIVCRS